MIFPLSNASLAIDFYPHASVYLFISVEPRRQRAYLIRRRLKELERRSTNPSPFILRLRKDLSRAELLGVGELENGVGLRLVFEKTEDDGIAVEAVLILQLGGRRPNIFLLDADENVIAALRDPNETGQAIDAKYEIPESTEVQTDDSEAIDDGRSLSETLDDQDQLAERENIFQQQAAAARKTIDGDIAKRKKLVKNLAGDLISHGDAARWKRYGDLILANMANARREGKRLWLTDVFDENQPEIEIEVDENQSLSEAAESFFRKYTKARNGAKAVNERLITVRGEIVSLEAKRDALLAAIAAGDENAVNQVLPPKRTESARPAKAKPTDEFKGARRFMSSDGFEILVGKKARDNDYLTFRIAKSLDTWMHAADFPGSHVVIRNPNRKEIPPKTLLEAAHLAAFYSDARKLDKAGVNYTQKKFVNKPKRSAPGLVSLASFKTILVEPRVPAELDGK